MSVLGAGREARNDSELVPVTSARLRRSVERKRARWQNITIIVLTPGIDYINDMAMSTQPYLYSRRHLHSTLYYSWGVGTQVINIPILFLAYRGSAQVISLIYVVHVDLTLQRTPRSFRWTNQKRRNDTYITHALTQHTIYLL